MDDEDGKGNGKSDDLAQAVVVAILKCLTSEVVKLALLQWVVLMVVVVLVYKSIKRMKRSKPEKGRCRSLQC